MPAHLKGSSVIVVAVSFLLATASWTQPLNARVVFQSDRDGEQIAFGRSLPDRSDFKLYVMEVDGKDQRPFLEDFGGKEFIDSGILWLPNSRILFSGAFPSFPLADRTSGVFAVEGENAEPARLIEWEKFQMHIVSWFDPAFSVQPNEKLLTVWGQIKNVQ